VLAPAETGVLFVAAVGWAGELEVEFAGAVWLEGLLTLIVGPLCAGGATVLGPDVRGTPKYITRAMTTRIARITPRITPALTPPPVSAEFGGVELI